MSAETHPLAPHVLPSFIGGADGSDPLFSAIIVIVVIAVLGTGYMAIEGLPHYRPLRLIGWAAPAALVRLARHRLPDAAG